MKQVKTEIKSHFSILQNKYCRVGSLLTKKNSDVIRIIDGVNNKESNIPTKEFFKIAQLTGSEFWYYGDLNPDKYYKNGNLKSPNMHVNTKLFNKYIIDKDFDYKNKNISDFFNLKREELLNDPKIKCLIVERLSAYVNDEKFVDAIGYDTIK
tara:strand:- start:49 stop:507 length:459 start_codon:yes stop_codon:yes gene_type:complete